MKLKVFLFQKDSVLKNRHRTQDIVYLFCFFSPKTVLLGRENVEMGCLEMLTLLLYFSGQNDMYHLQKLCFLTHLKCFQMKSFSGICTHLFKNITMQFLPISL